jgi:NAD dependent epimerase/dehydratase family enzyme
VAMTFEQRKVVIAGGSGFLGVSLAHHLATRGASVVILSRYGRYVMPRRLQREGFEFHFPELRGALQELYEHSRD